MTQAQVGRNARSAAHRQSLNVNRPPDSLNRPAWSAWPSLACAAIVLAGLAAYSDSFHGPFIFDDFNFISLPSAVKLWPVWPALTGFRPVAQMSLVFNYALGGPGETGYHVFNVIVHLLAALALFGVVHRTLTLPALASRFSERAAAALGFCIALMWALHPLQTEAVTYIIQRMESLMALFYLLTLYCVIRAAASRRPGPWHAAAVACCALGMGCKEVMVSAPILVLLYDRTFIAGSFRDALRRRSALYLGLAATWIILVRPLFEALGPQAHSAGFGIHSATPLLYAQSQFGVILHYLRLAFWPAGLCLDYNWPIARSAREIAPGAIVVGILLAATVWALVRRPAWGFIGASFFLVLAPTSSFMPIRDLAIEHRMYLPLAAVVAAAVLAAYVAAQNSAAGRPARFLCGWAGIIPVLIVAAALGYLTFLRNQDYRSAVAIWQDATEKRPGDPRAWNNLGQAYGPNGDTARGMLCFDKAIELDPKFADPYYNRASVNLKRNRFAEALPDFDKAIELDPAFANALFNRAIACEHLGGKEDFGRALSDYDRLLALKPDNADAFNNRGSLHFRMGQYDLAIRDYDNAIKLKPDYAVALFNRAAARCQMKEYDKARADVKTGQKLGGQPPPDLLQALHAATGGGE